MGKYTYDKSHEAKNKDGTMNYIIPDEVMDSFSDFEKTNKTFSALKMPDRKSVSVKVATTDHTGIIVVRV